METNRVGVFTVKAEVSFENVSNLLCSAFDPGYASTAYWCEVAKKIEPKEWEYADKTRPDNGGHWLHEYPLSEGGALVVRIAGDEDDKDNGKEYTLDLAAVGRGLALMAEKSPKHFADILDDNDDAITADVFVQYALLGEIIYG